MQANNEQPEKNQTKDNEDKEQQHHQEELVTSEANIVHIVDFGNNFSTAIVATSSSVASNENENGIITVISDSQLQEASAAAAATGTTYEYIPLQPANLGEGGQTRDALQAALESAEVDKMELLRTEDGTIIYDNSDSNSQPQTVTIKTSSEKNRSSFSLAFLGPKTHRRRLFDYRSTVLQGEQRR